MQPLVSVIIPCYNHGIYLDEAVASIPFDQLPYQVELVVVNDGSTDLFTLEKLAALESAGIRVVHQQNQGLAAARNNGIAIANGTYILPLDADNKLHLNYFTKAVELLQKNTAIDIVYGNARYFGNEEADWKSKPFNIARLLKGNYIDACALYRKTVWEKAGGYDGQMPAMGHEDWEFWVHAFINGSRFYYLDELCFYYRLRDDAMRLSITTETYKDNWFFIIRKHAAYFGTFFTDNYFKVEYLKTKRIKAAVNLLLGRIK